MYIGSNECNKKYRGRQTDSVSEPKKDPTAVPTIKHLVHMLTFLVVL